MKVVNDNDPAVLRDLCKKWIHTAGIRIRETQYDNLKKSPSSWYSPYCVTEFTFSSVND